VAVVIATAVRLATVGRHAMSITLLRSVTVITVRLILHSKDRSNLGVCQGVLDSVILAKVLPFQRRVQVLELNADTTLAQKVLLGQVIVNLVLGLVQMILVIVFLIVVIVMVIIVVVIFLLVVIIMVIVVISAVVLSIS